MYMQMLAMQLMMSCDEGRTRVTGVLRAGERGELVVRVGKTKVWGEDGNTTAVVEGLEVERTT